MAHKGRGRYDLYGVRDARENPENVAPYGTHTLTGVHIVPSNKSCQKCAHFASVNVAQRGAEDAGVIGS